MKALAITMGAFGPYRELQTIDFTTLGEESIFLITGPTGAGKTTIFDAMCFALYGRASGSDRDQDSMRSHFADPDEETFVEFQFELRGKAYRVIRMPKQPKKKERGEGWKEEPARAELFIHQDEKEKLIASKIKEVNEYIEELMGLDYEQFRKMIMIPQGEFRKLISENSKEREEILQRIFKTEFFEQLTEYFKKESKDLEAEIQQFEWKIDQEKNKVHWGMDEEAPEDEELSKFQERLNRRIKTQDKWLTDENKYLSQLQESTDHLQQQFYQAKQIRERFEEKTSLEIEKARLEEKRPIIRQLEKEIEWARKAAEVRPYEKQYKDRKQELLKWKESQQEKETQLQEIEEVFHRLQECYKQEEKNELYREQLKQEWEKKVKEQQRFQEYHELLDQKKKVKEKVQEKEKKIQQFQDEQQRLAELRKTLKEQTKEERSISQKQYEKKQQLETISHRRKAILRLSEEWSKLKDLRKNYQVFVKEFYRIKADQEDAKKAYESALEEIRSHHAYTLSLKLEEGGSCPVCGSTDHPKPAEKPAHVLTEEELNTLKRKFEQKDAAFQKAQDEAVQVKTEGETQKQLTEKIFQELDGYVTELDDHSIQQAILQTGKHKETLDNDLANLKQLEKEIEAALKKLDQVDKKDSELNKKLDGTRGDYYQLQQDLTRVQTHIQTMKEDYAFTSSNKEEMQKEVQRKEERYQKAKKAWEDIQRQYTSKRDEWQQIQTSVQEGKKYIQRAETTLEQRKQEFDQTLVQFSFSTLADYQQSLRTEKDLESISENVQDHYKRWDVITQRAEELQQKLRDKTKPDLTALEEKWQEKREALSKQQEVINEMNIAIRQNQTIQQTISKLVEEQGELAKKYYDIAELAQLAKGDNHLRLSLERYVLASFLDEILIQANIRLDQMTDHRYQLIRSDAVAKRGAQSGLDLEVIDHHTGQQRSVRTLSGGEGFKASLSLALGMADVVQAHAGGVQLETLFIDEGFGTLDELSLEQAIGCLRSLQDGNRMLGIISHVPQLKEEIPAKLQIHAGPKGSFVKFVFQ